MKNVSHSDPELLLLSSLAEAGGEKPYSFYAEAADESRAVMDALRRRGYLAFCGGEPDGLGDTLTYASICVTQSGYQALDKGEAAAHQASEQNARYRKERRAEARRSWTQFVIGIIVSLLSVLLAAYLAQHTGLFGN